MRRCVLSCLQSFAERFWSRVDKSAGLLACWPWIGRTITTHGERRGRLYVGGGASTPRYEYAARVAYRLATGIDPGPFRVLHSCDNTICCNPAHLRIGTQKDNALDRSMRLRDLKVRHRLTEPQVIEIRIRYATTEATTTDLAVEYGTSNKYLWKIVTGRKWAHVGGPITHGTKRWGDGISRPRATLTKRQ